MRMMAAALSLSLLFVGATRASAAPLDFSSDSDARATISSAQSQYPPRAQIWIENDRDYFRSGDRLRVNFSTSADSYVAVVHVDPDGYLDFVYPRSPWDADFVRAGRTYSLDGTGWSNGLNVRGRSGIGYFYVIASPIPLDYTHFRGRTGASWDWSYAGRSVAGDPFWAMEQITRMVLPGWSNVPYAVDYYSYYLGGAQRYPSYACSSRGFNDGWGWGYHSQWSSYYGSCSRLDLFLRDNPYYFDARRYRGDRRAYYRDYRDYRDWDPRHGYKVDPRGASAAPGARFAVPAEAQGRTRAVRPQSGGTAPASRPAQRAEPASEPGSRAVTPRPAGRQPAAAEPAAERTRAAPPRPVERRLAPAAEPRTRAAPPRPAERPATRSAPAPEPRTRTAAPRPVDRQPAPSARPQPSARTPTAAPRPRSSSGGGSSSPAPRSRRGGD